MSAPPNRPPLGVLEGGQGRAPERPTALVEETERALLGDLLLVPQRLGDVATVVGSDDFSKSAHAVVYTAMLDLAGRGEDVVALSVAEELSRLGRLETAGGRPGIGELMDGATGTSLVTHARLVRRYSLERAVRAVARRVQAEPDDTAATAELERLQAELDALESGGASLEALGFTGDRLRALDHRPTPISPLPDLLDPEPHVHVVVGEAKIGKTTLLLAIAKAWASGTRLWDGTPDLPGTRVLVLSREQPVRRILGTMRRLVSVGDIERATDQTTILARDAELSASARRMLTLDREGLAALRAGLLRAKREESPYGLLVLDSLSRLKPAMWEGQPLKEADPDMMASWLDALEDVAQECGVYLLLIHHQGHSREQHRQNPISAGRGASSIAQVAQVSWLFDAVPGSPHLRRLTVAGNVLLKRELTLEVCPKDNEQGGVHYFKPAAFEVSPAAGLLEPGVSYSQNDIAKLLSGTEDGKPSGYHTRLAKRHLETWLRAPSQVVAAGKKYRLP